MALAIRFNELLSQGTARNHSQLAQLGHVSRLRVCQILMLTNLAPTIQETLLFLPKTVRGRDHITERSLRGIAKLVDWDAQIQLFRFRASLTGADQVIQRFALEQVIFASRSKRSSWPNS